MTLIGQRFRSGAAVFLDGTTQCLGPACNHTAVTGLELTMNAKLTAVEQGSPAALADPSLLAVDLQKEYTLVSFLTPALIDTDSSVGYKRLTVCNPSTMVSVNGSWLEPTANNTMPRADFDTRHDLLYYESNAAFELSCTVEGDRQASNHALTNAQVTGLLEGSV